jgi:hypothetical protein
MKLGTTRLQGRSRNRWQDEVGRMEEAHENGQESSNSAYANGMNK